MVDFLKDSAVKQPLYHNTSIRAKENLLTAGADFERSATAAYGRGFYLATAPIKRYGPAEIRVAVDLRNPLDVDLDEFDLRMNEMIGVWTPATLMRFAKPSSRMVMTA